MALNSWSYCYNLPSARMCCAITTGWCNAEPRALSTLDRYTGIDNPSSAVGTQNPRLHSSMLVCHNFYYFFVHSGNNEVKLGMVIHAFKSSSGEAETGISLSLRPAWTIE
uniref:Uncharacterized protein n=1 Tax=Mus musculus TaxID=10090 RepID=Q3TZ85_MOUSE|nr:unnamed protein product [Mus musculus]